MIKFSALWAEDRMQLNPFWVNQDHWYEHLLLYYIILKHGSAFSFLYWVMELEMVGPSLSTAMKWLGKAPRTGLRIWRVEPQMSPPWSREYFSTFLNISNSAGEQLASEFPFLCLSVSNATSVVCWNAKQILWTTEDPSHPYWHHSRPENRVEMRGKLTGYFQEEA